MWLGGNISLPLNWWNLWKQREGLLIKTFGMDPTFKMHKDHCGDSYWVRDVRYNNCLYPYLCKYILYIFVSTDPFLELDAPSNIYAMVTSVKTVWLTNPLHSYTSWHRPAGCPSDPSVTPDLLTHITLNWMNLAGIWLMVLDKSMKTSKLPPIWTRPNLAMFASSCITLAKHMWDKSMYCQRVTISTPCAFDLGGTRGKN